MSILLDALKKSEEQRQLGKAPNIHGDPGGALGLAPGPARWVPVAMIALSVGLMSWMGWQQLRAPEETSSQATPKEMAQQAEAGGMPQTAAPAARRAPAASLVAAPRRTPVESLPGGSSSSRGPRAVAGANTSASTDAGRQAGQSVRNFQAAPANASEGDSVDAAGPGRGSAVASASTESGSTGTPGLSGEVSRPAMSQQESEPAPAALEPISYWQLPQNVRDDMPELKITVLVFAENPEDRFLLINGQRVVEKDEIPGGVVLDEIRRDGAVFEFRKYRFLVKG